MTTIIELTGPGTPVTDSILLTADYTIAATSPSAPRIKGTVNRISVQRGSRTTLATPDSLSFPFTFTGSIAGSLFQLDSVGGQPLVLPLTCINHTLAALTPLHQLFTILPSTIPAGGIWTDSSTIPVCSGSIPAKLTVIRTFRILGESRYEGQGALVLERVARSRLAGTGSQGQHHVTLDTQGSGSDTLRVSTVTGVLLASSGDHTARVAITSSGRTQEFQQRVRQRTLRVLGQ